ncbi:MAG: PilZ domain-containing protein [Myxococcota bacterium]
MLDLDQVLVIDGSRIVRDLLARLMRRHSTATHALDDCAKAREWIEQRRDVSLVIAEVDAPGGGAFSLLEFVAGLTEPRPRVLLTGRGFDAEQRARADLLGAIGCVVKPVSFQAIAQAVAASQGRPFTAVSPRLYARPPARVALLDPDGEQGEVAWNLHDLSTSGALIDTRGPLPLGARLRIALQIGHARLELDCEVVRVQEPGWDALPGVGVRFLDVTPETRALLEREIALRGPKPR